MIDSAPLKGGSHNGSEAFLEARLAKHDGDRPLSKKAEDLDEHARDLVSDLTEFDVRSSKQAQSINLSKRLWVAALALVVIFMLLVLSGFRFTDVGFSEPHDEEMVEEPAGVATAAEDSGPGVASPDASELTSGTWDMYWTNIEGDESVGFVLRFMDDEYGTLEFPDDKNAYDGRWDLDGDQISFGFARDFDGSGWSVTEWSAFEGTLVNPDLIIGTWLRDDWSCTPDDGCSTKPVPSESDSRLVRQP